MKKTEKKAGKAAETSHLAPYDLKNDLKHLARKAPHMARAIKIAGHPGSRATTPGFDTLIRIIAGQQVSTAAAAGIWAKLERNCGGKVTPKAVLALAEPGLRASGFSGQKSRYALGLAEATAAGVLDFKSLATAEDASVREILTAHKGVGNWTADIYMMFAMGRGDVWPAADLALQEGIRLLHGLKKRPTAKQTEVISEAWRPHRSSAAILLWHYYGHLRSQDKTPASDSKTRPKAKTKAKVKAQPKLKTRAKT